MEIPVYPDARPISMADKPVFDACFRLLQPKVSEFTFANLFLFRKAHDYKVSRVGGAIVVFGRGYDGRDCFLPPFGGDVAPALALLFDAGLMLYGADDGFVSAYLDSNALDIQEDRDSFDYLYLREELAVLPGNRFHKKKNRISYFAARHEYVTERIGSQHLDGCLELLALWQETNSAGNGSSPLLEAEAAKEALQMMGPLGLDGVAIVVEGTVKAFALGERLNSQTAVCHFEKADPFMEGLGQLVNREFSAGLFTECRFINREQDLGLMGLRNAKLSYHPVELIKKYRAGSRT